LPEAKLTPQLLIPARLVLANGEVFHGCVPDYNKGSFFGEAVFTTGMIGYPESLTDPSFSGQLLVFTYPLIGNYGVPPQEFWESEKIHAAGVVVNEVCERWSHHAGTQSLLQWLKVQNVPVISAIDTRALTKILRQEGSMPAVISTASGQTFAFQDPNKEHLVANVSVKKTHVYNKGKGKKVIYAVDCGMKENIIRSLCRFPLEVRRVPYNYDFTDCSFDGVFLSNGPGDPKNCPETVAIVQKAMAQKKPIFGICLGIQMLSLASGASTYKLPFGHRGHNQPCIDVQTKRCYMTSQNHGYAVDEHSLPEGWQVTFRNLNDQSVAGISHQKDPFFAVQFHPEATPGPADTDWLFEQFYQLL